MKKWFTVVAILVLLIAHQDYWQWQRADLVFGFLPYALAYHMVISMVTATVWLVVVNVCWPKETFLESADGEHPSSNQGHGS